tara:strand:+ start:239 stop:544 length:306 start_codon:yes stop_codon:yes gene_type:complete
MSDDIVRNRFPLPIAAADVAADWRARGYSCHDFDDPPGQQWNDFTHTTNEVVTVVHGRLRLLVEDRSLDLGPGDEAFIPRHARHSVHNIHDGRTRWLFGYD